MLFSLAILFGKFVFFLTRTLKVGGGSAAPGLNALRIYPKLITDLSKGINQRVVITGTNGKTTTARLLTLFAKDQGLKVINNKTGSNMERGIASALIEHISLKDTFNGKITDLDLVIWESDEAAFNQLVLKVVPTLVVFLNVSRDQMDRYGEVDTTVKKWLETLKKLPANCQILINSDDHNLVEMASSLKQPVTYFSSEAKISGEKDISNHHKHKVDYKITHILNKGISGTYFNLETPQEKFIKLYLPLPGSYQLYNFLAAFCLGAKLHLNARQMLKSLHNFLPAFGRFEQINLAKKGEPEKMAYIFLIKNPIGATQVLQVVSQELKAGDRLLLALNDNSADGKDVSWIWDADFESLKLKANNDLTISGTRALDLANRLKYAGILQDQMMIEPDLEKAFLKSCKNLNSRLFILPTYTALLQLQKTLEKNDIKKHYWQEP